MNFDAGYEIRIGGKGDKAILMCAPPGETMEDGGQTTDDGLQR